MLGGAFSPNEIDTIIEDHDTKFVLYKIYGSHPVYGNNVLLYIGMTEQGVKKRLAQHDYWMDEERFGSGTVYFATAGMFSSWESSEKIEKYEALERAVISEIEALLIYAHRPAQNSKSKGSAKNSRNIRLFNTGSFGVLMPEVSGKYQNC